MCAASTLSREPHFFQPLTRRISRQHWYSSRSRTALDHLRCECLLWMRSRSFSVRASNLPPIGICRVWKLGVAVAADDLHLKLVACHDRVAMRTYRLQERKI